METTLFKKVKGSTMEKLFEHSEKMSIRYFSATDLKEESEYDPDKYYTYEVKIRHAEESDANELFISEVQRIEKPKKNKDVKKRIELCKTESELFYTFTNKLGEIFPELHNQSEEKQDKYALLYIDMVKQLKKISCTI